VMGDDLAATRAQAKLAADLLAGSTDEPHL
jgi:hypothetical protein